MYELYYKYYKENCGAYNRIFSKMKAQYYLMLTITIAVVALFFAVVIIPMGLTFYEMLLAISGCFVVMGSIFCLFNINVRKIVCKELEIGNYRGRWNNYKIVDLLVRRDKELLEKKIREKNPDFDLMVQEMSIALEKDLKRLKSKFPIMPVILGGMLIVLYTNIIMWMYKSIEVGNFENAWMVFSFGLTIIVLIIFFVWIEKKLIGLNMNGIFNIKYNSLKRFQEIIMEIN